MLNAARTAMINAHSELAAQFLLAARKSRAPGPRPPVPGGSALRTLIAGLACPGTVTADALAQPVEVPTTRSSTRTTQRSEGRGADEVDRRVRAPNPNIKVRVVVDPTGANGARTLRTRADSPDVVRATSFQMPEYVATGSLLQLDDLVKRDKVDPNDWLLPLAAGMVDGHVFGLPQDYRIPILIYRKQLLEEAKVTPPRTWPEVCDTGAKLTENNVMGYAIPLGTTGGIGGAQAFGEFYLSTLAGSARRQVFRCRQQDHRL